MQVTDDDFFARLATLGPFEGKRTLDEHWLADRSLARRLHDAIRDDAVALDSAHQPKRYGLVHAIEWLAEREAFDELAFIERLLTHDRPWVRQAAAKGIAERSELVIDIGPALLAHRDPGVRTTMVEMLAATGEEEAAELLEAHRVAEANQKVQRALQRALAAPKPGKPRAVYGEDSCVGALTYLLLRPILDRGATREGAGPSDMPVEWLFGAVRPIAIAHRDLFGPSPITREWFLTVPFPAAFGSAATDAGWARIEDRRLEAPAFVVSAQFERALAGSALPLLRGIAKRRFAWGPRADVEAVLAAATSLPGWDPLRPALRIADRSRIRRRNAETLVAHVRTALEAREVVLPEAPQAG